MAESKKEKSTVRTIIENVAYILGVLLIVYLILHYVGQRTVVDGPSMEPTLNNAESLIMDKISYRFHDPERFDIVIFPGVYDEESGTSPYYIKRVIGMPGETIQIVDGKVEIDGEILTEDTYGITDYIDDAGIVEEPLTLAEDEYFCMGDNRPVSYDSRYEEVGPVTREEIVGKVWIRIWPLSAFGDVDQ